MGSFHGMDNDPVNIGSLITASVTSHRVSGRFCKFAASEEHHSHANNRGWG